MHGLNRPDDTDRKTVLVLELRGALDLIHRHAAGWGVVLSRVSAVDQPLLDAITPGCILFPLFGPRFDATQVIERLQPLRFSAKLCVVTAPLPAPRLVEAELRGQCRGCRLDLIVVPDLAP